MKNFKTSLHVLLTFASLLGFLGGWATLAHSRKPIQPTDNSPQGLDPLPALAPMPAIGTSSSSANSNSGLFSIAPQQSTRRSRAFFATSGS